jgi:hypothetical protein
MLHPTIADRYVKERTMYGRLLRMAFSFAGIFWFLLYALPHAEHEAIRSDQTVIYFVLLTLWGLDYMREQRRLTFVITEANAKQVSPEKITLDDVAARASWFTMVTPRGGGAGLIMPIFFGVGIVVAYILIVLQYIQAIAIFVR